MKLPQFCGYRSVVGLWLAIMSGIVLSVCHKAAIVLCVGPDGVRSHDRAWPCWALAFFGDNIRRNMEDADGQVWLMGITVGLAQ